MTSLQKETIIHVIARSNGNLARIVDTHLPNNTFRAELDSLINTLSIYCIQVDRPTFVDPFEDASDSDP